MDRRAGPIPKTRDHSKRTFPTPSRRTKPLPSRRIEKPPTSKGSRGRRVGTSLERGNRGIAGPEIVGFARQGRIKRKLHDSIADDFLTDEDRTTGHDKVDITIDDDGHVKRERCNIGCRGHDDIATGLRNGLTTTQVSPTRSVNFWTRIRSHKYNSQEKKREGKKRRYEERPSSSGAGDGEVDHWRPGTKLTFLRGVAGGNVSLFANVARHERNLQRRLSETADMQQSVGINDRRTRDGTVDFDCGDAVRLAFDRRRSDGVTVAKNDGQRRSALNHKNRICRWI